MIVARSNKAMSKEAWINYRNSNSQISWEDILASGFDAVPCACGKQGCHGWKLERVQVLNKRSSGWPSDQPPPLVA